jgi:hypothetical protein
MTKRVGNVESAAVAREELPVAVAADEGRSLSISRRGI